MTRSQPPNEDRSAPSAPQSYPPGQYQPTQYPPAQQSPGQNSPAQYQPTQYPAVQYPPETPDGAAPPMAEYGQPGAGSDTSPVARTAGQPHSSPTTTVGTAAQPSAKPNRRPTRIGAAWVALIVAAVVLIFLLIFIVQNSGPVQIRYFGFDFTMPLGVAMLFAAVAGALTAGLLGTVRILQLRKKSRQALAQK